MRFKEVKRLIKESTDQELFEIKMTGKNLSSLAKAIPGVMVGLEFEMIVPDVQDPDSSGGYGGEPDYDTDEIVRDIDDAVGFFDDGDHNSPRTIRSLREEMDTDYREWKMMQIDEAWSSDGFEFFQEYLDREEPFDEADYEDDAEEYVKDNYPDLDPDSEEFEEKKTERLHEINADYYTAQWEEQGRNYNNAYNEFTEEQEDNFSEQDWLRDQGIRYASDVQNNYTDLAWPHYISGSSDGEEDIRSVALNFMKSMGYSSIAVSTDYHGSYYKWDGNDWKLFGTSKPTDCFSIEPDGSLSPDDDNEFGLEFVSPPIPLDQIDEVMSKVQKWAHDNGVYTGKSNKTSMHTNISIPGYSIEKLDYLKAALLLGDEHVLRQFDRIGNTYAKPAIERVKQLVKDKPDKAKEMLDLLKGQLNAQASKLLHSGVTDKFTSINTKDNRIEFRSPGGDYLKDIASNPKKMTDTINRMVVAMDAALDPNKYKEEYQKKLYKALTGDIGSREPKTGEIEYDISSKATIWNKDTRRQEPAFKTTVKAKTAVEAYKTAALTSALPDDATPSEYNITPKPHRAPDDKDLLKYFTRYAAGELPKAALKNFVRQAQLQRKIARDDAGGKYWWSVERAGSRIEVVAKDELDAKLAALREWGRIATDSNLAMTTAEVLRPYEEAGPKWGVWDTSANRFIDRFGGSSGENISHASEQAALDWANRAGLQHQIDSGGAEVRQITQQQPAQQQGPFGIWDTTTSQFATGANGQRIERDSREDAGVARAAYAERQGRMPELERGAFEIRPIPQGQPTSRRVNRWEIVNNRTGDVVQVFTGGMEDEATNYAMDNYGHRFTFTTRPWDGEVQRVGNQIPNYYIKSRDTDEIVKGYFADDSTAAHEYLTQWKRDNNLADSDYVYGRVSTLPDTIQRNIVGNQPAPQQSTSEGNWGIWVDGANRFARMPGEYPAGQEVPLRRFPNRESAEQFLTQTRESNPRMRMDVEVREIEPTTQQSTTQFGANTPEPMYEIVRDRDHVVVHRFFAANQNDAIGQQYDFIRMQGWNPDEYTLQAAENPSQFTSTENVPREGRPNNLIPHGPGPWEIYRISNGETVRDLSGITNRSEAEQAARNALGIRGEAPELYGVRTRHPAPVGGSFTGEWKIVDPQGNEIYRFSGVGNVQADANNVAMDWLRRNPRQMVAGVEVLPVMG